MIVTPTTTTPAALTSASRSSRTYAVGTAPVMRSMRSSGVSTGRSVGILRSDGRSRPLLRIRAAAEETKSVSELIEEQGIDMSISGLRHLPEETQRRYARATSNEQHA